MLIKYDNTKRRVGAARYRLLVCVAVLLASFVYTLFFPQTTSALGTQQEKAACIAAFAPKDTAGGGQTRVPVISANRDAFNKCKANQVCFSEIVSGAPGTTAEVVTRCDANAPVSDPSTSNQNASNLL